jgi:hypothetical protein
MAESPGVESERLLPRGTLHLVVRGIFDRCGMTEGDAAMLTAGAADLGIAASALR